MKSEDRYIIEGGQRGKTRLSAIARILQPTTLELFERVGLKAGMHCLDVGCGGGDVTLEMARWVGATGKVVGYDFDAEILKLAKEDAEDLGFHHVEFQVADALTHQTEPIYDFVYARHLLTHLSDPARALTAMIRAAKPGGYIVVQDVDFSGWFCYPPCAAIHRFLELYYQASRHTGGDPEIGLKLVEMFLNAGIEDVQVNISQRAHIKGDGKSIIKLTMERISRSVVSNGFATQVEVDQTIAELAAYIEQPNTIMGAPRLFQVWGMRAQAE